MKCPVCNYTRVESDETPEWQCPQCKRAYNKSFKTLVTRPVRFEGNRIIEGIGSITVAVLIISYALYGALKGETSGWHPAGPDIVTFAHSPISFSLLTIFQLGVALMLIIYGVRSLRKIDEE